MTNKILDGITNALYAKFGSKYSIYTEDRQQGTEKPCFFVSCVSGSDERRLGGRRKLENKLLFIYTKKVSIFPAPTSRRGSVMRSRAGLCLRWNILKMQTVI